MPELIDKQASMKAICDGCFKSRAVDIELKCRGTCNVIDILQQQPTIEPEVLHGRWIKSDVYTFKKCSECGAIWDAALCENIFFIYCPRCGSKNGGADNG